jgi:mRNA interferase MazF
VVRITLLKGAGHEQHGHRRAVVMQSNAMLARSTVIVAPTSQKARPASFRPDVVVEGVRTRVLVEQMRAVDAGRLGEVVGHLDPEEQWALDAAAMVVLGLR